VVRIAVRLEGFRLATRAVQGKHQLGAWTLAKRFLSDEALQLADHFPVAAALDICLDAILERRQPQLLDSRCLGLGEVGEGEVGKGRAAPQGQRRSERLGGLVRIACVERAAALRGESLEAVQVKLLGVDLQDIAWRARYQQPLGSLGPPPGLERLAKLRHVDLQRFSRGARRFSAPQQIDEALAGDDFIGVQQQDCQQRPLLRSP
jgi:hypothetical protein